MPGANAIRTVVGVLLAALRNESSIDFSRRLVKRIAEKRIGGLQCLPVTIEPWMSSASSDVSVANVVDIGPALDIEHSHIELFPDDYFLEARRGSIRSIRGVALLHRELWGAGAFRFKEYRSSIYVTDEFVSLVQNERFIG